LLEVVLGLRGVCCLLRPPERLDMREDMVCVTQDVVVGKGTRRVGGEGRGGDCGGRSKKKGCKNERAIVRSRFLPAIRQPKVKQDIGKIR